MEHKHKTTGDLTNNTPLKSKQVGTNELRQIVGALNSEPFSMGLTLVSFDEKSPMELVEIINAIFGFLDNSKKLDMKKETAESIGQKFGEFLKLLDYPIENEQSLQNGISQGNKKLLHFILHWVVTRLGNLQQRAYLAKFLVKIAIPPDLLEDEEMREYNQQYQEMQSEFQATHMHVENIRKDAKDPKDLEKKIAQLDQEKEQLVSKIAMFKKKNSSAEFQQLVEATSMLRKAQEEGSKIYEKMNEQRQRLEICEQQLLHTKQKLIDTKKMSGSSITSDKMLELLKMDVKKSRELCEDILGRELMQKRERLQQAELILSEPSMTQSDLERLNNEVKKLHREVIALDEKCKKNKNPQDDKLAIYKSQAALIAKKKDTLIEQAKKLEVDEKEMDKQISTKEGEFTANKGFKTKGEFKAYSNTIKTKNAQFKKMKAIISDIRAEINVLINTEKLLKIRLEEAETSLKQKEKEKGIEGITEKMSGMEEISEHQENVNKKKQVALEEISQKVTEITNTINSKKFELQPVIEERKKLKDQYQTLEHAYNAAKQRYDSNVSKSEKEKQDMQKGLERLEGEYLRDESKYHLLSIQAEINEVFSSLAATELSYKSSPEKKLNSQYKSYNEWYTSYVAEQETKLKALRIQQKEAKSESDINSTQITLYGNLLRILEAKSKMGKPMEKIESNQGEDRLVL